MKVFSTLLSDQIDLKRTSAEGVAGLKSFLEYAEKGKSALSYNSIEAEVSYDGFVESVASEIRKAGYDVKTNIGCSGYRVDIGIVNPENHTDYVLGILCDGYNYYSSKSSRDREIIQIGILRKLGWKIYRVWSMDWWNDRPSVMGDLLTTINAAISGTLVEEEEAPLRLYSGGSNGNKVSNIEAFSANEDKSESPVRPYITAKLDLMPVLSDNFIAGHYTDTVKQYILKVIEVEAPIRQELLCKRVIKAFNISRMGNRVSGYLYNLIDTMNLKTTSDPQIIYWRDDQDLDSFDKIRVSPEREAVEIPSEEARNAAYYILEQQDAIMKDDLVREMAKLFGYYRTGDNVVVAMIKGIDKAISLGKVEENNGISKS